MFKHLYSTIKILCCINWALLTYFIGKKTRFECIQYISSYLTSLNIVYSKLFQALSTGINFLSLEEMNYLSKYNDNAPYEYDELYDIHDIINQLNIASSSSDKLILNSDIPINSGIISIVYGGVINNEDVVIKIKRKNIEHKLDDGIQLAEFIAFVSSYIPVLNKLKLETVVRENKETLLRQIDFDSEVLNMIEIKHRFRNVDYITIPKPYEHYTKINDNVIVMEQVKGFRRHDVSFDLNDDLKLKFASLIAKFIAKSMFIDKHFHSDLHSGNVFFDNTCEDNLKLGIIDFGLVNTITGHMQNIFFKLFKHIVMDSDYNSASELVFDIIEPINNSSVPLTENEIEIITDSIKPHVKDIFELCDNGCDSITNINNILSKYNRQMTRDFYNLYISLVMSAGLCNGLCSKETKFLNIVKSVIKEMFSAVEIN